MLLCLDWAYVVTLLAESDHPPSAPEAFFMAMVVGVFLVFMKSIGTQVSVTDPLLWTKFSSL